MKINWIKYQLSTRSVRIQIEQSGLIPDLVALIKKHTLKHARANQQIEHPNGIRNEYECAVVRHPKPGSKIAYHVFIKELGLPTYDAIGEICKQ